MISISETSSGKTVDIQTISNQEPQSVTTESDAIASYHYVWDNAAKGDRKDFHPHTVEVDRIRYPNGTASFKRNFVDGEFIERSKTGVLPLVIPGTPSNPDEDLVYNKAVSDLYDKLKNGQNQLAIDYAERKKTKAMLRDIANEIINLRRNLKNFLRNPNNSIPLNAIGDQWLRFHFGIEPLVGTVQALVDHVTSFETQTRTYKGRASETISGSLSGGSIAPQIDNLGDPNLIHDGSYSSALSYELGIQVSLTSSGLLNLSRETPLNPASFLWETMPYSFIIDWFIDVSSYLQNAENSYGMGFTFIQGYVTRNAKTMLDVNWNHSHSVSYPEYSTDISSVSANAQVISKVKSRSLLTGFPLPRLPPFQWPHIGGSRAATIAALLSQFTRH